MPGFTKVDNPVLERVLTSRFTKRQIKILLLIVRFSIGFQKTYALLRKNDFAYAGVSASCIKDELRKLGGMRVVRCDPQKDAYWLNPNLDEWAVEKPVDSQRRFFKIAAKNSPKWQLSLCRNGNLPVAKTGTQEKERQRYTKDSSFLKFLDEYFLKVSPLSPEEALVLREVAQAYGSRTVQEAINAISSGNDRSFSDFLKALDSIASTTRSDGLSSLRSSLEKYVKMLPRQ